MCAKPWLWTAVQTLQWQHYQQLTRISWVHHNLWQWVLAKNVRVFFPQSFFPLFSFGLACHEVKSNSTIKPMQSHSPSVLLTLSQHSSSPQYKLPCLMPVREKGCCHTLFVPLSLLVSVSTESASKQQAYWALREQTKALSVEFELNCWAQIWLKLYCRLASLKVSLNDFLLM